MRGRGEQAGRRRDDGLGGGLEEHGAGGGRGRGLVATVRGGGGGGGVQALEHTWGGRAINTGIRFRGRGMKSWHFLYALIVCTVLSVVYLMYSYPSCLLFTWNGLT